MCHAYEHNHIFTIECSFFMYVHNVYIQQAKVWLSFLWKQHWGIWQSISQGTSNIQWNMISTISNIKTWSCHCNHTNGDKPQCILWWCNTDETMLKFAMPRFVKLRFVYYKFRIKPCANSQKHKSLRSIWRYELGL